jgi:hypothetical protein
MKPRLLHALSSAVVSSLLVLALASGAFAYGQGSGQKHSKGHRHHHAAELDPTLISNGLTLLAGSVLLLMERKRRHS